MAFPYCIESHSPKNTDRAALQLKMTRKIKALAFDLDGLMVNTEDIYDLVCDELLGKRGHQFSRELKLKMMGRPGYVAIRIMKDELGLSESIMDLQEEVAHLFHELMPRSVQTLPGLDTLLDFVDELGIPKCVATSSFRQHAFRVLEECNLTSRFDFVLTSEDVTNGKPHPEIYLLAAQKHQVIPREMLVLEDSVHGTRAGVDSGSVTVAIPGKHSQDCDYSHVEHRASTLADELIFELLNPNALPVAKNSSDSN